MRSRAEWALRAAVLAALALMLWRTVLPADAPEATVATRGALERTLVEATREPVAALSLGLDSVPGPVHRDWLRAIRTAGTSVTWNARGVAPIAVAAAMVPEPEGRVRVAVAGSDSARVVLSDALGAIDTLRAGGVPAATLLRTASGALFAAADGIRATAPPVTPVRVRRVLVLGSAGWESKFVIAALEEAGWMVDARIRVAPGVETRQGADLSLDTARYSAVVALDGAAAGSVGLIERYVAAGGGAILAGVATRLPVFSRVTPAAASARRIGEPRPGLALGSVKADAVVLESRGGGSLIAARRSGSGRVVASGYDETWKWRMSRADDASASHREWWTALVSAVAYAPPAAGRDSVGAGDPAPMAALTAALGPPSDAEGGPAVPGPSMPPVWLLFGVLLAALLGETLSRRLMGAA
ncbi:MAG: hypothetical protein ACSLFE_10510 [Gemmatimonadaceae bacterium]